MADRARRWARRVPRAAPAARWRRWAAGLASVRSRAVIGRSRPALVLAGRRPGRAAQPRASWTFAPQVRLSMALLLPTLVRELRSAPGVVVRMASAPSPEARMAHGPGSAPSEPPPIASRGAPTEAARTHARAQRLVVADARTGSRPPAAATPVVADGRPAALVVGSTPAARARRERRPGAPLASPALVLGGGAAVLRRVRDERRRIEQRTAQPTTSRARPAPQPTPIAPTPSLAGPSTFTAPWADPHRAEPPSTREIDIPGLTDHVVRAINERIVAQHERMGRAF